MIIGFYQSIPLIITGMALLILEPWLTRRFSSPKQHGSVKRDVLSDVAIVVVGIVLVIQPVVLPWLGIQITASWGLVIQIVGVVCLVTAVVLYVWVRFHLRELFSEQVELQPEHYVIKSGPYSFVRHPMYTSFILMALGQLLVTPAILEVLALCGVIWHFSRLAKDEDLLLSKQLPGYKEYMDTTSGFVPWKRGRQAQAVNEA